MNLYDQVINTYQNLACKSMQQQEMSVAENAFMLFVKQNFSSAQRHQLNSVQIEQAYRLIP